MSIKRHLECRECMQKNLDSDSVGGLLLSTCSTLCLRLVQIRILTIKCAFKSIFNLFTKIGDKKINILLKCFWIA